MGLRLILLVTKGLPNLLEFSGRNIGRLIQPRATGRISDTPRAGFLWAADNDCYQGLHEGRYRSMLEAVAGVAGCLFITVPDVVGDSRETMALFSEWVDTVRDSGPVALVAQDGLVPADVPWEEIQSLFIGGTTNWKMGEEALLLMKEARERGKWIHMGRVNSIRRIRYAQASNVDSIDGTMFSRFTDHYLAKFAEAAALPAQAFLEGG